MEVDNPEESASTTAVVDPMEGSSTSIPTVTPQTITIKSDLNMPW
jgi:hypothetical protein